MNDCDRFKLVGGPYQTPNVRKGDVVFCEARKCDVVVTGLTSGPLAWPKGRAEPRHKPGIIVFGALADAVRRESNQALCRLLAVERETVTRWRTALGVPRVTEGTHEIHLAYTREEYFRDFKAKGHSPEAIRKIAEANRGQKRPRRRGWPGHPADWVPRGRAWTAHEDRWVRHLPVGEVVRRTGRTPNSVHCRRRRLGVARSRQRMALPVQPGPRA
jgi:hypothetical protein